MLQNDYNLKMDSETVRITLKELDLMAEYH